MDFHYRIDWYLVAKSFLINQKACSCNVINHNDGANFFAVYSVFVTNK